MRVQRAGTASNRVFACYPMVTTGAGAYDVDDAAHPDAFRTGQVNYARPDVYLKLLAGITWDGTEITNSAGFWSALVTEWGQKNIWGALDLTDVGRGTAAAVVIGNGRGLAVDQLLVDTFETNHLSILDGGQIECGDNVDVTFGNNPSIRFTGPVNEIIAEQGGLLFDLGTASEIRLGSGSQITLNAALLAVDETSLVSLSGTLLAVDGSYVIKHAGSDWQLRDQVFTGTPSRYGLYGAQIPRAIAHVEAGGDLAWGFNIDTVERTGEGVYVITLKRPLASTSGFCATAGIYLDGDLRQGAQVTSAASGGGGIAQFTVKTFYLDNPVASVEAVADDARFVFQVLGGELLA
ncbi:MAG: hypothetical protein KJ042_06060 [Deltaproteobacteria bacterium]|nr:hypothetical protein [Deltaproteobacteria bacterium]